jgi:hypothetical protein
LLLLGHLFGEHLDAGQSLELLLVRLQVVGARILGEAYGDRLSTEALPIEAGLSAGVTDQGGSGKQGGGAGE